MTFQELGVSDSILHAIDELGFVQPMPVQEAVIPYLLGIGNDVIALAQTGTGKTAAYGIPLLQKIDVNKQYPQAVIISPTRELCLQISEDIKSFAKYIEGLRVIPVYGGANIESQIKLLKKGVQIIVATPGRLIDLMERGAAKLDRVENVVLDEADEMLNMGFSESIDAILAGVPENRNTLLFSATMSKEIEKIAMNYLHNPKEIVVGSRNEGAEFVNHEYYLVQAKDKYLALKRIADFYPKIYAIIFCRTRLETQEVADKLIQDGYNAEALHGDLSQQQRDLTMQKFRQHLIQLLVATDVAARGLDVDDLTHVINYGLPDDIESYTHRSGRTGRAGKKGTSISIVHLREKGKIKQIEKTIGKKFVKNSLPSPQEICTKQLYRAIDKLERAEVDEEQIAPFMAEVYRKLEWLDKEEIIKRFVSMTFGRFIDYYAHEPQIEEPSEKDKAKSDKPKKRSANGIAETGFTRFFFGAGKRDGFYASEIICLLNRYTSDHIEVGKIDLKNNFSFFEVPEDCAEIVESCLTNVRDKNGRRIPVERAEKPSEGKDQSDNKKSERKPERRHERKSERNRRKDFADEGHRKKKKDKFSVEERPEKRRNKKEDWKQFFTDSDKFDKKEVKGKKKRR